MAGNERFDDSIGMWLQETAPDRLPQRVLAATFERTRRARQDPAWRAALGRAPMTRFVPAFGGVAAVLVAAMLALNLVPGVGQGKPTATPSTPPSVSVSPSPSPSPAPSPSSFPSPVAWKGTLPSPRPGYSRFLSPLQGIAIDYPTGWMVRPATEAWGSGAVAFAATDNDVIYDPARKGDFYIGLASGPLPPLPWPHESSFGLEAASKMCDGMYWDRRDDWGGGAGSQGIYLGGVLLPSDGVDGWAGYCHGHTTHSGYNSYLFARTATRGYVIYLHSGDQSVPSLYAEDWFDKLYKAIDVLQ